VTPRQRAVLVKMVEGIFGVAWIGLLALLPRGYHTISLILTILICTMLGIGALTSIFDRRRALSVLTVYACVGVLSLLMHGYQTLFLVIALAAFGIGALTFLYYEAPYVWRWWFPDQPFGLTVKRWLRYLAQAVVVAVAYVHMRVYINYLTGVDPGNFPTALAALTVVLVFTEYSYNQTCSVSSEQRLVAHLKDRKEMRASIISIADDHGRAWPSLWWIFPLMFFQDYTFSRGTCDDQSQP
jgi:hypothetical protein